MRKRIIFTAIIASMLCCACQFKDSDNNKAETKKVVDLETKKETKELESTENDSISPLVFDSKKSNIMVTEADLNQDGNKDKITLDLSMYGSSQPAIMKVLNQDGKEIFMDQLAGEHVGWGTYYICEENGISYLVKYNDYSNQGSYSFTYEMFSFDIDGNKIINKTESCGFSIYNAGEMNTEEINTFFQNLNNILGDNKMIFSTSDKGLIYNQNNDFSNNYDIYSVISNFSDRCEFANTDTILMKLEKVKKYLSEANK